MIQKFHGGTTRQTLASGPKTILPFVCAASGIRILLPMRRAIRIFLTFCCVALPNIREGNATTDVTTSALRLKAGRLTGTAVFARHVPSKSHYIITAYHNIYKTTAVSIAVDENSSFLLPLGDFVEPLALLDPANDLAVFRCTEEGTRRLEGSWKGFDLNRRAVDMVADMKVPKGARVIAVGNPRIKLLGSTQTPLNLAAGASVREYALLSKRSKNVVVDQSATATEVLFLEDLAVEHGFSGGPVLYSESNLGQDEPVLLAGIVDGGGVGVDDSNISWAIPAAAIAQSIGSGEFLPFPPATWRSLAIGGPLTSGADDSFLSIVQIVPNEARGDTTIVPLAGGRPTSLEMQLRVSGPYRQLAAILKLPASMEVLTAPIPVTLDAEGLFTFRWKILAAHNVGKQNARVEFRTERNELAFELPLHLEVRDDRPQFDVTPYDGDMQIAGRHLRSDHETVQYVYSRGIDGITSIEPESPYLMLYRDGGPIRALDGLHFFIPPPVLSIKVFNGSGAAIDLTELTIDVEEASVDRRPLLRVGGGIVPYGDGISFENEGWGRVINPKLSFRLQDAEPSQSAWLAPFPNAVSLKTFDESVKLDIKPFLPAHVRKTAKSVWAVGELEYQTEAGERARIKFAARCHLDTGPLGGNILPTFFGDVSLDPESPGQRIHVPLARRLVQGELEHLALRVLSTKSGYFTLRIGLRSSTGSVFQDRVIRLHVFRPRSIFPGLMAEGGGSLPAGESPGDVVAKLAAPEAIVRRRAAQELADAENPSETALLVALYHSDPGVRAIAVRGLGRLGLVALPELASLRGDESAEVRSEVDRALQEKDLLAELNRTVWRCYLREQASCAEGTFVEVLANSEDPNHRDTAAAYLAWRGRRGDAKRLASRGLNSTVERVSQLIQGASPRETELGFALEELKDSEAAVRVKALETIRDLGTPLPAKAITAVTALLGDTAAAPDAWVSYGTRKTLVCDLAADLLGDFGAAAKSALPELAAALRGGAGMDNRPILQAVISIGPTKDWEQIFLDYLKSDLRWLAAAGLAQIGPDLSDTAVQTLTNELAFSNNESDADEFLFALARADRPLPKAIRGLLRYSVSKDANTQWRARQALAVISQGASRESLVDLLDDATYGEAIADVLFGWVGLEAVPDLIKGLQTNRVALRISITNTLQRYGVLAAEAVPALERIALEQDVASRAAAESALKAIHQ